MVLLSFHIADCTFSGFKDGLGAPKARAHQREAVGGQADSVTASATPTSLCFVGVAPLSSRIYSIMEIILAWTRERKEEPHT